MFWHKLLGFAVLAFTVALLHQADSQAIVTECKNNFTLVNNKCLRFENNWISWYDADRQCRQRGAGLVILENSTVLTQLTNWMKAISPFTLEYWTAGNTLGKKGTYYWQSTGEQAKYLPWGSGEPKPNSGDCLSLYAATSSTKDYRLMVRNCSLLSPYVCEAKPVRTQQRLCLKATAYDNVTALV